MNPFRNDGKQGQALAKKHLLAHGYRVLAENVRLPIGEIDLIAEKNGVRAFVEVKSGREDPDFPPSIHFHRDKANRYRRLVTAHLTQNPTDKEIRVDLISVSLDSGRIEHYENVLG